MLNAFGDIDDGFFPQDVLLVQETRPLRSFTSSQKMKHKPDFLLLAIVIVGIAIFVFKCGIVYHIKWIGDTDEATYVEMMVLLRNCFSGHAALVYQKHHTFPQSHFQHAAVCGWLHRLQKLGRRDVFAILG
jgi:hypothetical protein